LQIENEQARAGFWRHPRTLTLALLALSLIVALAPLILAGDSAWVIGWSDVFATSIAVAAALKCFATTGRLQGQQRTAWIFISLAYLSYALGYVIWSTYELILDIPNPLLSPADAGFLIAPLLLIIGIWLYRTSKPTLPAVIVQFGNAGILVAAIFLANMIVFQQLLEPLSAPGLSATLIVYAVIGTTAFIFALFNICFYMRGRRRLVMMPLLFALGSLALANHMTVYEIVSDAYTSSSYANIGYFFTFAFGYWAAFEQGYMGDIPAGDQNLQSFDEVARQWETLLPPLTIAGLVAVVLTHRENLTADLIPHATGALILFITAIALRDWWMQRIETQLRGEMTSGAASLRESEQHLLAKNEELAAANRKLSNQKMEAIGQLTGGVAHDFNNLLAVIVGNVDLLEQTLEPDSSQRVYTQEAKAATNRGAALTERLLAFSRKQALDPRPIGIGDLLTSMTDLLERTLGETIQLQIEVGAGTASCMVDRAHGVSGDRIRRLCFDCRARHGRRNVRSGTSEGVRTLLYDEGHGGG